MAERDNNGLDSTGAGSAEDMDIIDVADLMEESLEPDGDDIAELADSGPEEISAVEFEAEADDEPIDLNEIFSELDDMEFNDDEDDDEIIDLVETVDSADEPAIEPFAETPTPPGAKAVPTDTDELSFDDFDLDLSDGMDEAGDLDLEEDFISAQELEDILGDPPPSQDGIALSDDEPSMPKTDDIDFIDSLDLDLDEDFQETMDAESGGPASGTGEGTAALLGAAAVAASGAAQAAPAAPPAEMELSEDQIDAAEGG